MLHHLSDGEGFFLSLWIFLWKSCKNLKHAANQRNDRCKLNTENKAVLVNPPWSFSPGPWLTSDLQQAEWWHQKEPEGFNLTRSSSEILLLDR